MSNHLSGRKRHNNRAPADALSISEAQDIITAACLTPGLAPGVNHSSTYISVVISVTTRLSGDVAYYLNTNPAATVLAMMMKTSVRCRTVALRAVVVTLLFLGLREVDGLATRTTFFADDSCEVEMGYSSVTAEEYYNTIAGIGKRVCLMCNSKGRRVNVRLRSIGQRYASDDDTGQCQANYIYKV